jgi:lactoylglutathione lyase
MKLLRRVLLASLLGGISLAQSAPPAVTRPAIVGVAHIALRTDNLEAARKFYTGVLGFEEPFTYSNPPEEGGGLLLTYFKVNDHQYIEMFPELTDPTHKIINSRTSSLEIPQP